MTCDRTTKDKFDELRRQAEKLLCDRPDAAPAQPTTALDLINELQIHQVELEVQNEELKRAQGELSALHREYEALYEFAPCGYVTLNQEGIITRVNLTAVRLLETDRKFLQGSGFSRRILQGWKAIFLDALNQAGLTGEKQTVELRLKREDAAAQWVRLDIEADRDETGWTKQWRIAMTDITERKCAEVALKSSEQKFRNIADNVPGLVLRYKLNPDGSDELFYISKGVADLYEISQEEALKSNNLLWDRIHRADIEKYRASIKESAENLALWEQEHRIELPGGGVKWVHTKGVPGRENDGSVVWDTLALDITKRKQAELDLEKRRNQLVQAENIANVGSWEWDIAPDIVHWSDGLFRIFRLDPAQGAPKWAEHPNYFIAEDFEPFSRIVETCIKIGAPYEVEMRIIRSDGEIRNCLARGQAECGPDGKIHRLYGIFQDITDRKQTEEALQDALAEKEVLLREIHHRVKNNMQAISALLRMHARRAHDDHLTEIFTDCRDRIGAMSLIHEALYHSDNLARIDFETYLKKLCRNLAQAHDAQRRGITLTTRAAEVSLDMDQGVAVGMIIAELISNAFKHAFPNDEGGAVTVHLDRPDGKTLRLVVSDTGKGLPADFEIEKPSSLGMRLVSGAVTRELGGTIKASTDGGAKFVIRFKSGNRKNHA